MEYYSAIKKNEILLFPATQMSLEDIILSEINQAQKDKYRKFLHAGAGGKKRLTEVKGRTVVTRGWDG